MDKCNDCDQAGPNGPRYCQACFQCLKRELETLTQENFSLSAGVCKHLVGDEHGHTTCSFRDLVEVKKLSTGYGRCPKCGKADQPDTMRERRPDGNTRCGYCGWTTKSSEWRK